MSGWFNLFLAKLGDIFGLIKRIYIVDKRKKLGEIMKYGYLINFNVIHMSLFRVLKMFQQFLSFPWRRVLILHFAKLKSLWTKLQFNESTVFIPCYKQ